MKTNLVILTKDFPNHQSKSEGWLSDEIYYSSRYFNCVYFIPEKDSGKYYMLPGNCEVTGLEPKNNRDLNFKEKLNCLKIVLSDFTSYPQKKDFIKSFRYNLALIKKLHVRAKTIHFTLKKEAVNTLLYAYWADDLATTACIMAQRYGSYKVITRGHGYEIFEEQTKYNVISFRKFQNKYLTKIFADSGRGYTHLNRAKKYSFINDLSYVGTKDYGISLYKESTSFSIATCSYIRGVKRLHLLPEILKHITFNLTWYVLGDGEDLGFIKKKNLTLPPNISVVYKGYLENDKVLDFYKTNSINLFVSLSYSEGLPVTMMEAQSFGIPIMSTDVGGCGEICGEETGFLIDKEFNPEEVAKKITEFKNSGKNSLEFRKQCRNYWEKNFSAEINYTKFSETISVL